jgi:hypothetical protein
MCRESNSPEPCVKTWGPKKQQKESVTPNSNIEVLTPSTDGLLVSDKHRAERASTPVAPLNLSRPISNYDPSIDPVDTYILQRAYLELCDANSRYFLDMKFLHLLVSDYGLSIAHPSLRQAIVLFCHQLWPDTRLLNAVERQRWRTRYALRCKIAQLNVDAGDLFATFFVARYHYLCGEFEETKHYSRGFNSLMKHLLKSAGETSNETAVQFWVCLRVYLQGQVDDKGTLLLEAFGDQYDHPQFHDIQMMYQMLRVGAGEEEIRQLAVWPLFLKLLSLYAQGISAVKEYVSLHRVEIAATLDGFNQEYSFRRIDFCLGDITEEIVTRTREILRKTQRLLYYHCCRLILSTLDASPPGQDAQKHATIVAATRLFDCIRRLEDTVNQHTSMPTISKEFPDIPSLAAVAGHEISMLLYPPLIISGIQIGQSFTAFAKKEICRAETMFCKFSRDIIRPLLADIIELVIPPRGPHGERGWLVKEFLWDLQLELI